MVPDRLTRREVLGLSSAAAVGLAGCPAGGADPDRGSPTPTATEREYANSVDAPESVTVRNPEGRPAVRSSARSPEEDAFESSASWAYEDWLVTAPGGREGLSFSPATTGVEAAREFLTATDLSEATLLVHQYDTGECETRRLARLEWDTGLSCGDVECVGIHLDYDRTERDGCQTDSGGSDGPPYEGPHANEATFVRVPARIASYGRFSFQV